MTPNPTRRVQRALEAAFANVQAGTFDIARTLITTARDGLSNPDVGARLFPSARTVEWHLRKVFTKLGISSRKQLRVALAEGGPTVARA